MVLRLDCRDDDCSLHKVRSVPFFGSDNICQPCPTARVYELVWFGTKSDEVLSFAHRSSDGEQECVRNLSLVDEELCVQVGTQASGHALTLQVDAF